MKNLLRVFFLACLAVLCLGALSSCSDTPPKGLAFNLLSNDTYEVYPTSDLTDAIVVIPSTYKGKAVTSVSSFRGCTGLTSIEIPNSVTSIGASAFSNCTGLTNVTIGNSVERIGYCAFSGCTGLTSIVIPDSVTSIGIAAFDGCTGLKSVTIGNSVKSIGTLAFDGCTGLKSVTFKNTNGWKADNRSLSSTDLSNKYTAAKYLKSTYYYYDWTRK